MTDLEVLAAISLANAAAVQPLAEANLLSLLWMDPKRLSWCLPDQQVGRILAALELARCIARETAMQAPFETDFECWARSFYLSHARGDRDVYGVLYLDGDRWLEERLLTAASFDAPNPRLIEVIRPALDLGADRFVLFNIHHRGDTILTSRETRWSLLARKTARLFGLRCLATFLIGSPTRSRVLCVESDHFDFSGKEGVDG